MFVFKNYDFSDYDFGIVFNLNDMQWAAIKAVGYFIAVIGTFIGGAGLVNYMSEIESIKKTNPEAACKYHPSILFIGTVIVYVACEYFLAGTLVNFQDYLEIVKRYKKLLKLARTEDSEQ